MTEGRQAFARRLAGIKGGVECERFAPLLSALADGEASAEQLALLRPHMKTCLACRARLKAFWAAPAQVASAFGLRASSGSVPVLALVSSVPTALALVRESRGSGPGFTVHSVSEAA